MPPILGTCNSFFLECHSLCGEVLFVLDTQHCSLQLQRAVGKMFPGHTEGQYGGSEQDVTETSETPSEKDKNPRPGRLLTPMWGSRNRVTPPRPLATVMWRRGPDSVQGVWWEGKDVRYRMYLKEMVQENKEHMDCLGKGQEIQLPWEWSRNMVLKI